jgi:hypothetical protein
MTNMEAAAYAEQVRSNLEHYVRAIGFPFTPDPNMTLEEVARSAYKLGVRVSDWLPTADAASLRRDGSPSRDPFLTPA